MRDMTIGGLAREAGVNVETVRYCQRLGDPRSRGKVACPIVESLARP